MLVQVIGLINSLCPGGAQRQMALLGKNLKRRGIDFSVLTYHDNMFFKPILDEVGVPVKLLTHRHKFERALDLYRNLRRARGEIIVSFLDGPNVYAELARIPGRPFGLIVSERSGIIGKVPARARLRFKLHQLADFLVTNSWSLQEKVVEQCPKLTARTRVILNCVDLNHFSATPLPQTSELRLLVLARYTQEKNAPRLLEAFLKARAQSKRPLVLDWYGDTYFVKGAATPLSETFLDLQRRVAEHGAEDCFRLHPPSTDPRLLIQQAHAVVLASFYEGCPNVACEALASGRPVLVSDVCDNGLLVKQGQNGMLFDPHATEDMVQTLQSFAAMSQAEHQSMGDRGRQTAESLLSEQVFTDQWLELILEASRRMGFEP